MLRSAGAVVILLAFLQTSWSLDGLEDQYGVVEYVNVLFRHGARTPDNLAPGDPHRDLRNWPEGLGQLTKEGILQHFNLGAWLDKRYRHLLPRERSRVNEALNVVSTDWDRTLMSADAEMSGIFPIVRGDAGRWSGLTTFPVPIHSIPPPIDRLLEVTARCRRYSYLVKDFEASEEYNKILDRYQSMTDLLVRNTGNRFVNLDFYMELFTTYFIEESRGLALPDWVKQVYPRPMIEPTVLSFVIPTWTTDMKRLRGGPFIKEIIENFWNKVNGRLDPPSLNMSMYSAHDTTISAVLNSMGVFNFLPPPFASMVLMELRKMPDGERNVLVWYKNSTTADPVLLTVPKCTAACPLNRLERLLKPVIPENWATECENVPFTTRFDNSDVDEIHYDTFGRRKNKDYYKKVKEDKSNDGTNSEAVGRSGKAETTTPRSRRSGDTGGRLVFQ